MLTRKQLALVHIAKKQTGMTEKEYRDLLSSFGVSSSKDLPYQAFAALMNRFKALGFVSKTKPRPYRPATSKYRLMSKVRAIQADMDLSDDYINGMVKKMFKNADGMAIVSYRWLNERQLHKLVAALSYHQNRHKKKPHTTPTEGRKWT